MSTKYLKRFIPGHVYQIPLGNDKFAFCCFVTPMGSWFYGFTANALNYDVLDFSKKSWFYPVTIWSLPKESQAVASIETAPEERGATYLYYKLEDARTFGLETCYRVAVASKSGFKIDDCIEESQTKGMFLHTNIEMDMPLETLEVFMKQHMTDVPHILVSEVHENRFNPKTATMTPEPEPLNVRILLPAEHLPVEHYDVLEEALMDAFDEKDMDAVDACGVWPDGTMDLSMSIAPKDWKRALTIMRRVLKKLKFPPEHTIIRILGEDGAPDQDFPIVDPAKEGAK